MNETLSITANGTTPNVSNCVDNLPAITVERLVIVVFIGGVISVIGIALNTTLIILLFKLLCKRNVQKKTSSQLYLLFLAFFDVNVGVSYMLLVSLYGFIHYYHTRLITLSLILMKAWWMYFRFVYTFSQITLVASAYLVVLVSVERCLVTCFGQECRAYVCMSAHRLELCCLAIVIGVLVKTTSYFEFILLPTNCPDFQAWEVALNVKFITYSQIYMVYWRFYGRNIISSFVPFACLIVTNALILKNLRGNMNTLGVHMMMGQNLANMRKREMLRHTQFFVTVITTYLIANALHVILTLIEFINVKLLHRHMALYYSLGDFTSLLTTIVCSSRLLVYLKFNDEIRQMFATGRRRTSKIMQRKLTNATQSRTVAENGSSNINNVRDGTSPNHNNNSPTLVNSIETLDDTKLTTTMYEFETSVTDCQPSITPEITPALIKRCVKVDEHTASSQDVQHNHQYTPLVKRDLQLKWLRDNVLCNNDVNDTETHL